MSYDVSFRVKVEKKDIYIGVSGYYGEPNITWNVRELIKQSSGWEIKNCDSNGSIFEWANKIKKGIAELETSPEKYKQYESPNGWGTVEGTLSFYRDCLKMFDEFIKWEEELADVAVVWVS